MGGAILRIRQPEQIHLRIAAWGTILFELALYYLSFMCLVTAIRGFGDDRPFLLLMSVGALMGAVTVTYLRRKVLRILR